MSREIDMDADMDMDIIMGTNKNMDMEMDIGNEFQGFRCLILDSSGMPEWYNKQPGIISLPLIFYA